MRALEAQLHMAQMRHAVCQRYLSVLSTSFIVRSLDKHTYHTRSNTRETVPITAVFSCAVTSPHLRGTVTGIHPHTREKL